MSIHLRTTTDPVLRAIPALLAVMIGLWVSPGAEASEIRDEVRSGLLERINRDRARHGLAPVSLDPQASSIADSYCGNQIEVGTRGHYSVDGLPPYMRYSFAGIEGTVLENVAAWSAKQLIPPAAVPDLAMKSHLEMISEIPPGDGHRKTILDPHATHVGIGVGWGGGEVRVAEVFLRRYAQWISADRTVVPGETVTYRAQLLPPVVAVDRVTVHFEPFPFRLSRERANRIETYALPPEWLTFEPERQRSRLDAAVRAPSGGLPQFRIRDGVLELDVELGSGRGVYTIVVWVRTAESAKAFAATNLCLIAEEPERSLSAGGR